MAATNTAAVRHATRDGEQFQIAELLRPHGLDVPFILQAIQELALYEKEPDSVKATEETLRATIAFQGEIISSTKPARCYICFDPSNNPKGIALYFYNYSTWTSKPGIYLEDLYVTEDARNKGYGQLLLGALAKEVVDMNGGRLDWSVLKWNKPSIDFYERLGAQKMEEWMGCRVDGDALVQLARKAGQQ